MQTRTSSFGNSLHWVNLESVLRALLAAMISGAMGVGRNARTLHEPKTPLRRRPRPLRRELLSLRYRERASRVRKDARLRLRRRFAFRTNGGAAADQPCAPRYAVGVRERTDQPCFSVRTHRPLESQGVGVCHSQNPHHLDVRGDRRRLPHGSR